MPRLQQRVLVPVKQQRKVAVKGHQLGAVMAGGHRDPGVLRGVAAQPTRAAQQAKRRPL